MKDAVQFTFVEVDAGATRRVVCQCKDDEQYEQWVTNVDKVLQRQMDLIIGRNSRRFSSSTNNDSFIRFHF